MYALLRQFSIIISRENTTGFPRAGPRRRSVYPGSLARRLGAIRDRWVHLRATWVSLGSCWVVGSQAHALGVVGYIHVCWVHSRALCGSLVSSEVVGFTHVRLRGRWVHPA